MAKILLIEDDKGLGTGLKFALENEGYGFAWAGTLKEGYSLFEHETFDLILLDINLPDGTGYHFCKSIRLNSLVPIIFLTALDEELNIVMGLDMGGDDYITKPFRVSELLSRIKALLRRSQVTAAENKPMIHTGNICVELPMAKVKKDAVTLDLTATEYKLLLIFLDSPKVVLSKEALCKGLLDMEGTFFDENTLAVYIKRLREKIEEDPKSPLFIQTQRGHGYSWNVEVIRK